jgi:DMSO/TMAO reductase YedYZ molybdopterin-dependent catalytic subunit
MVRQAIRTDGIGRFLFAGPWKLVADNCPNRIVYMAGQTNLHGSSSSIQPTFTSGAEIRGRNNRSLKWSGVPLHFYLRRVGAELRAKYVAFDDYWTSIDLPSALHPRTILALERT